MDVKACGNKYIANLRTIEVCIYNSVSMSGGQLIMYQQLIFKLYEGKYPIGAYGWIYALQTVDGNKALVWKPELI